MADDLETVSLEQIEDGDLALVLCVGSRGRKAALVDLDGGDASAIGHPSPLRIETDSP